MAQDMVSGLFGLTPSQIERQRYADMQKQGDAFARMNSGERGVSGMFQAGAGLAQAGAKAMGWRDPEMEAATQQREAMSGVSFQNPKAMRVRADEVRASNPEIAARLDQMANALENDMSQRTLEAAQAKKAGNPNWDIKTIKVGKDLIQDVKWDKTGQHEDEMLGEPYKDDGAGGGRRGGTSRVMNLLDRETRAQLIGVPAAQAYQMTQENPGRYEEISNAPDIASRLAAGKLAGAAEAEIATDLEKKVDDGKYALPKIDNILKMLDEGKLNVGPGSEFFQALDRAKIFFFNNKTSGKYVSDTDNLKSMLGAEVFGMIQSLGIGARGMDTPAEREFLLDVLAGRLSLTKDTLKAMSLRRKAEINRQIAELAAMKKSGEYDKRTGNREDEPKPTRDFNPATGKWEER